MKGGGSDRWILKCQRHPRGVRARARAREFTIPPFAAYLFSVQDFVLGPEMTDPFVPDVTRARARIIMPRERTRLGQFRAVSLLIVTGYLSGGKQKGKEKKLQRPNGSEGQRENFFAPVEFRLCS